MLKNETDAMPATWNIAGKKNYLWNVVIGVIIDQKIVKLCG